MKRTPRMSALVVGIAIIGLLSAVLLAPLTFAGAPGRRHLASSGAAMRPWTPLAQASPKVLRPPLRKGRQCPKAGWRSPRSTRKASPSPVPVFPSSSMPAAGKVGRVIVMGDLCDDSDDESDGELISRGLQPGDYVLVEAFTPEGFAPAPDTLFSIQSGVTTEVVIEDPRRGTLVVQKVAEDGGDLLAGACFQLYTVGPDGMRGRFIDSGCDDDGDGLTTLGAEFAAIAGSYILVEFSAPAGYLTAPDQLVEVTPGTETTVTVENRPGGVVVITKTDQAGDPLFGACFALIQQRDRAAEVTPVHRRRCDGSDGTGYEADGVIALEAVPTGDYILAESFTPPGYLPAADRYPPRHRGGDAAADDPNQIGGSVVIHKTDEDGEPLADFIGGMFPSLGSRRKRWTWRCC